MSLYPQPYGYPPSYPPQHGYQQYQHPPPQPYYTDPNHFRRDYMSRLAELTVNTRPAIQSLSMIAQEYYRWASIVAQCLETHIRRVQPWMKLPAFYVLDAISKNVFEPYAREFSAFVTSLFLETYQQVDQSTRGKMEEMLLTWRNGAPNGKELFGVAVQVGIERGIWGGEESSGPNPSGFPTGHISKAQVLSELEFTLSQKQRILQSNPYDTLSQTHVQVLLQLRGLVEAGVTQQELRQILDRLRSLTRPPPQPVPQPPAPYTSPPSSHPAYQSPSYLVAGPSYSQPAFGPSTVPRREHADVSSHMSAVSQVPPVPSAPAIVPAPAPASAPALPPNFASLLGTLIKAGVVSASNTPEGAGSSSVEDIKSEPAVDHTKEASRDYRKTVLSRKIKLNTAEITKKRTDIVSLLYKRLPSQCKQCGVRFSDSESGKHSMDAHLDMHFKQNIKATQNVGRGHSRSWFVGVEDWIHDISSDAKGKGRADGFRLGQSKAAAAAEAAKRDAELRAQYVVVPPGDEAKTVACPICQEVLKSEFLEDDEEWVWKNAITKDDRVYHATCHAEASHSATFLAARIKNGRSSRSRSGTPERSATPPRSMSGSQVGFNLKIATGSPLRSQTGTKRKADSEATLTPEAEGSPAHKKLASLPSVSATPIAV